jgi:IS1 family transposase
MKTEQLYKKVFGTDDNLTKERKEKLLQRVRNRRSYKYFSEVLEWLKTKHKPIEILHKIHSIIDDYRGFHSETNSIWAKQSINLIEIDNKEYR